MSNIHDLIKDDDVCGQIIGGILSVGFLTYEGRRQRQNIFAENVEDLKEKANKLFEDIKDEMDTSFKEIFPNNAWKLRILQ